MEVRRFIARQVNGCVEKPRHLHVLERVYTIGPAAPHMTDGDYVRGVVARQFVVRIDVGKQGGIGSGPAVQSIISFTTAQFVISISAKYRIIAGGAEQKIVSKIAREDICGVIADNDIVPTSPSRVFDLGVGVVGGQTLWSTPPNCTFPAVSKTVEIFPPALYSVSVR